MESVLEQKLEKQQIDERSLRTVTEALEFWGITKKSNPSSGSKFSHSTNSSGAKNKNGVRRRNGNVLKTLFFIFCSRKWLHLSFLGP
jgi:hypothetical protein